MIKLVLYDHIFLCNVKV